MKCMATSGSFMFVIRTASVAQMVTAIDAVAVKGMVAVQVQLTRKNT